MSGVWRQGDPLVIATDEPVSRDSGRIASAYGEATGYAHAVLDCNVELFARTEKWFRAAVGGAAASVPAEHGTGTVPPGTRRAPRQRDYAPRVPVEMAG